jgi:hypothetical protein
MYRVSRTSVLVALSAHLLAAGAFAEGTAVPGRKYALTARLELPDAQVARFVHDGPVGLGAPSNPPSTSEVGVYVRDAYAAMLAVRFEPAPAGVDPDVGLEVSIVAANVEPVAEGWRVFIAEEAVVRTPQREVGRWSVRGEAAILGIEAESIPKAFARAADDAVRKFELAFASSPAFAAWLRERGLTPIDPQPPKPPRGDWVAFLDGGPGFVNGADDTAGALLAGVGIESSRLFVQLSFGHWTGAFAQRPVFGRALGDAQLPTTDFGLELGPVSRLGRDWELRAGIGAHVLWGTADTTYNPPEPLPQPVQTSFPFRVLSPTVLAAIQYAGLSGPGGVRVRASLQFRMHFRTSLEFAELQSSPSVAGAAVGLFVGGEFPWGSRQGGSVR